MASSVGFLSSLLLFWSEGVEGLEGEAGMGMEMSSVNMDISWSSSRRSKGGGG